MNAHEKLHLLEIARAKISDPQNWTQGAEARDENGIAVLATRPNASCFCVLGACISACDGWLVAPALISELGTQIGPGMSVVGFNDQPSTTHADVLALFDGAIARLRTQVAP